MKITTLQDKDGNAILVRKCTPTQIKISLKLAKENRERNVGELNPLNKIFYVKRKRNKHLHYKSNSYGFNHYILSNAKRFEDVLLTDEMGEYKIPTSHILSFGKFLFFKQQGFEVQIFLTLDEITKFKL